MLEAFLLTDHVAQHGHIAVSVTSDSPVRIAIKCFIDTPPPPGFKECHECGIFVQNLSPSEPIRAFFFDVPERARIGEVLAIEIVNHSGERHDLRVIVDRH